jgi:cation:H+ antiporter
LGTSLPELAVTFTAAFKKHAAMALGNILGSNIFDFLFILGLTAMIRPVPFRAAMEFDIMVAALATVMLVAAVRIGRKYMLERWQGLVFAITYAAYVVFLFIREGAAS